MSVRFVAAPFVQNAKRLVETDEDYLVISTDEIVDVIASSITITFPKNPLHGQSFRILASGGSVVFSGNGYPITPGAETLQFGLCVEMTFSVANIWIPSSPLPIAGLTGATGATGATGPASPPAPPNRSLQFDDAGVLGSADEFTYLEDDGELRCEGGFYSFGPVHALSGDIRLPPGVLDAGPSWSVKKRSEDGTRDVTLFETSAITDPGEVDESLVIGCSLATPDPNDEAFGTVYLFSREYFSFLLTRPGTVITGDYQGFVVQHKAVPDDSMVEMYVTQHTNFAIAGRRQYPTVADYGNGRAVMFWGVANTPPSASSPPTTGIALWVDETTFSLMYRKPDGSVIDTGGNSGAGAVTSGATTVTVCASSVIPDNSIAQVEVLIRGRETTTGELASSKFILQAKRVSGILSLVGSQADLQPFTLGSDAALLSASATLDISANTLRVRATGVTGKDISWSADMRVKIN